MPNRDARMDHYRAERETMVARQIEARGLTDPLVLAAMRAVPRELFVPQDQRDKAYRDRPLPIGEQQTISQPYIVARMIEALGLEGGEKVLEIGAGSGYAAAVLAQIASRVTAVERIGALGLLARANLAAAGVANVEVVIADGTEGWSANAPYDAILVSAGAPEVPASLKRQLAVGGSMVIPVGSEPGSQQLLRIARVSDTDFTSEDLGGVRFVPLIGREGWDEGAG